MNTRWKWKDSKSGAGTAHRDVLDRSWRQIKEKVENSRGRNLDILMRLSHSSLGISRYIPSRSLRNHTEPSRFENFHISLTCEREACDSQLLSFKHQSCYVITFIYFFWHILHFYLHEHWDLTFHVPRNISIEFKWLRQGFSIFQLPYDLMVTSNWSVVFICHLQWDLTQNATQQCARIAWCDLRIKSLDDCSL
jgi:hypothetical protein